ncbi:hypothetical protein EVAR_92815_1 [Eumeta japonica]|uniref:Uncharacterized protein n=1 Tax=Eumeta variegata TaxID=151549 RepID=A0A4C1T9T0_EUMVA|nr:hypothetical protein EVAR_92815_1 [Eumeta japonica]
MAADFLGFTLIFPNLNYRVNSCDGFLKKGSNSFKTTTGLHLSGQKAQGVPTARRSGNPSGLPRRNNVIAIGIWSAKTTGALPRRRNRAQARRADGRVAGASRRDGCPWFNCRRATYTAWHPTHSYTRGARHWKAARRNSDTQ